MVVLANIYKITIIYNSNYSKKI